MGSDGTSAADANGLAEQFLSLANELLQVTSLKPDLIEFRHSSEVKSFLGSKKKTFEALAKLEPDKRKVNYWQTVQEDGSGFGFESGASSSSTFGSNMVKFSGFVVKGVDRSGSGVGFSSDGAKFKYDLSKVRDQVKSIAEQNGWKLGNALTRPK